MAEYISKYTGSQIDGKLDYANMAYATCEDEAATAAKTATIVGNENWELKVGSIVIVNFTVANSAQENVTLNVNGTGAKSIYYNNTQVGTSYYSSALGKGYNMYMYDGTNYIWMGHSVDNNTTYSQASLGQGYGTCSTAAATVAKVVTLSSYSLVTNGIVSVKFTYAVPASATMNINSKGAKAIYYRGAAITAGVIEAGDVATFIYNGSQYHLISVDKINNEVIADGTITRAKLATDTLYSPQVILSTTNYTITNTDTGKTIRGAHNSALNITLTKEVSAAMPSGAEIAILRYCSEEGGDATVTFSGGINVCSSGWASYVANPTIKIPNSYGMIALKKLTTSNMWLVTGKVEVIE